MSKAPEPGIVAKLLEVARKDYAEWMVAFERKRHEGDEDAALECLSGANTVRQLLKRMEKEAAAWNTRAGANR